MLFRSPHTAAEICGEWSHPYTREKAVFPLDLIRNRIGEGYLMGGEEE